VRLPKALRLDASEVLVRSRGRGILIEPLSEDGWGDFWDRLLPLRDPVKRWETTSAEPRKPL